MGKESSHGQMDALKMMNGNMEKKMDMAFLKL